MKDVLTVGTARHVAGRLRRVASGRRQDRHPAEQLDRGVRRGDAVPVDGSAGARPGALHLDGQHPRVPRRRHRQRAGRHVPGAHLGCVHGAGACLRAGHRLAQGTTADPPALALYLPGVECLFRTVSTATTLPTDAPPGTQTPTVPTRPAAMSRSRHHRRPCHPVTADRHHDARRSDGHDRAAAAGVHGDRQRHHDPARRARPASAASVGSTVRLCCTVPMIDDR